MKNIIRVIKSKLVSKNIKPIRTTVLPTGFGSMGCNIKTKIMSREIKFRVWDEDSNKILRISSFTNLENLRYDLDAIEDYFGRGYFKDNPNYLMQFTGLKDKNGVDIYEGDKLSNGWEISFKDGMFGVFDKNHYMGINSYMSKFIKVIGNIYENK